MRLLFALLLFSSGPAEAFLFGGAQEERAAAGLARLSSSFRRGDCPAVLELSDSFLREKPSAAMREEAYGYMGPCYESAGSTDKAISLYKLALGLYPENVFFSSRLGLIYNKAGFPENAAPLFLKVLSIRSDDLEATLGLARAYAALGFLSRAKEFYSRAVILQNFLVPAVLEEYALCMLRKRDWPEVLFLATRVRRFRRGPPSGRWRGPGWRPAGEITTRPWPLSTRPSAPTLHGGCGLSARSTCCWAGCRCAP